MMLLRNRKVSFRVSIATMMIVLTISLSAVFLFVAHNTFTTATNESANRLFSEISAKLVKQADKILTTAGAITEAGAFLESQQQIDQLLHLEGTLFRFMANTLKQNVLLHALFIQERNGDLARLISLRDDTFLHDTFNAGKTTRYILQHIRHDEKVHTEYHLANDLTLIKHTLIDSKIKNLSRPWFERHAAHETLLYTEPYIFDHISLPGISCTIPSEDKTFLFGADITLERFTHFLFDQQISPFGNAFIFNQDAKLIAHPREPAVSVIRRGPYTEMWFVDLENSTRPEVREIGRYYLNPATRTIGQSDNIRVNDDPHIIHLATLNHEGLQLIFAVNAPTSDFTGPFQELLGVVLRISVAAIILAVAASFLMARRLSFALSELAKSARKVQQFDFSERFDLSSLFLEIDTLIKSFSLMRRTVRQRTHDLLVTQDRLQQLVEDGIALASQNDARELSELSIAIAKELAQADGAVLYRTDDDNRLIPELVFRESRQLPCSPVSDVLVGKTKGIDLESPDQNTFTKGMITAIQDRKIVQIPNSGEHTSLSSLPEEFGTFTSALLIPLTTRKDKLVGLLQLVPPVHQGVQTEKQFDHDRFPFIELLAAQAATAIDNQHLLKSQQLLLDSFIKVLAGSIDTKSPHTGKHCSRVPDLALMIARAAHDQTTGPLAEFKFNTPSDWHEFETAAWLHDCGKIITPEYVVNKATKLETIYNRINEVRLRFEVIWRDLQLQALKQPGTVDLHVEHERLQEEFRFIAQCNRGTEKMGEEAKQRVCQIAARSWQAQFDTRLGLSEEELHRLSPDDQSTGIQYLLADRPDHLIAADEENSGGPDTNRFNLTKPEYRMNLGEVYNLTIGRGTLTAEERYIIQEHIIQSIFMLESLPFPAHMKHVVEYACRHHEKVNGKGYPLSLKGEEMSVPAKILAIADIFEALTAADRPYKHPMSVEEATAQLRRMTDRGEIDAALFQLFVESNVIDRYQEKYIHVGSS